MLPALLLLAQAPLLAVVFLGIRVLLDLHAFCALAVRQTTEADVARANDHLRRKTQECS